MKCQFETGCLQIVLFGLQINQCERVAAKPVRREREVNFIRLRFKPDFRQRTVGTTSVQNDGESEQNTEPSDG